MSEYVKLLDGSTYLDDNVELHNCCYPIVGGAKVFCSQISSELSPGDAGLQNEILISSVIAFVEAYKMRYALVVDAAKVTAAEKMFEAALIWNLRGAAANISRLNNVRATGILDAEYKSYKGLFYLADVKGNPEKCSPEIEEKCIKEYIAICLWCVRCVIAGAMNRGYKPPPLRDLMGLFSQKITRFYEVFRCYLDELKY